MQEIKSIKEQAIDHLSVTTGDELDLSCNITSPSQLRIVMESEAHTILGSNYVRETTERMLRLTCGWQARHRQDIVEIAKSAKLDGEL